MNDWKNSAAIALQTVILLVLATPSWAYIPRRQTIVGRVVKSHGKGSFIIEQDVVFRTSSEPVVVHERWAVNSSENMRVTVTATNSGSVAGAKGTDSLRYDILYRNGKRYINDGGAVKSGPISKEFVEAFFHARSVRNFYYDLVAADISDADALRDRSRIKKLEDVDHSPDPQVRLGRVAGTVAWILGAPSPAQGPLNPALWIDQDEFTIRKIRFPTEAELVAERYAVYAKALHLPRERTIFWGSSGNANTSGASAVIRVTSVRSAQPAQLASSLEPSSLANLGHVKIARLPDVEQVKEFYARFR